MLQQDLLGGFQKIIYGEKLINILKIYFRSKRSRFITFVQADTKSEINLGLESSHAYTSANARNCELDPNIRSARVPVHFTLFVFLSRPSNISSALEFSYHFTLISSKLTKKAFVSVSGFFVNTP